MVSFGAGLALATIVGVLLGLVCFQLRGVFLAIATLAFVLGLQSLVYLFSGVTGGGVGLLPITPWSETHVLIIAAILVAALMAWIDFSPFGKALDAVNSDEVAAASIGLPTDGLRIAVFAISGLIGGFGGALLAHHNYAIFPSDFSFSLIVAVLIYVVIGGSGSWWGPAIGTVVLVALPEILRPLQTYRPIFHGLVLVVAVLFMPRGAVGLARQALERRRLGQAGARG
jgi:branched-chain amino acid transport system permease protein